jgi:uncharacterized secreted protein with C-terminal beta-propeller domain
VSELQQDVSLAADRTLVQKFQISGYDVAFQAETDVPGQVLNQYSMDEQNGYFRIATTTGEQGQTSGSGNNIFIYDPNLELAGQLTGLAPGEHIYAARFLGNRAYLVTYQQIDPFFVVDLTNPALPKMLGSLNISGFSDYLQPYDDSHIIGIGQDTTPNSEENNLPRPAGLKIALFDATNPQQPKELSSYVFPEGSNSQALYDPRALLFSQAQHLLALPVSTAGSSGDYPSFWQGAYVFNISLDQGIVLEGTIEHPSSGTALGNSQMMPMIPWRATGQSYDSIQRILYIGNVLYTVSDGMVKLNDVDNLAELKAINLP